MKTKVLMTVGDEVKYGMVEVLASPHFAMTNDYGTKLYPAAITPTRLMPKRGQVGLIVDRCFIPLMTYKEFITGIRRKALFKEHLTFVGWELLRLKAIAMKDEYKLREELSK